MFGRLEATHTDPLFKCLGRLLSLLRWSTYLSLFQLSLFPAITLDCFSSTRIEVLWITLACFHQWLDRTSTDIFWQLDLQFKKGKHWFPPDSPIHPEDSRTPGVVQTNFRKILFFIIIFQNEKNLCRTPSQFTCNSNISGKTISPSTTIFCLFTD